MGSMGHSHRQWLRCAVKRFRISLHAMDMGEVQMTNRKKVKNPRMPVIPPVQPHKDRKNDYVRKPKHPYKRWKEVEATDGDWQDF